MALSRDALRRFMSNCDPKLTLFGKDPRYVPLDDVRGGDGPSCVDLLAHAVDLLDESCQLFSGFQGTGKTTELHQLTQRLESDTNVPTHVVYVDFEEFVDVYSPIGIADVLRVIAYSLDRDATRMEGDDPDKKLGYLRRFVDFVKQTDVEFGKIDLGAYGAKLMLEFKNNPDFYKRAEAALSRRFQLFVEEARQSMSESVARLKKARGAYTQRVVVIADGLEKLQPRREEDREGVEASVELLLSTHARLLRLPCHVIYTFPLWLRYRRADLGASYDGEPIVLPMVKVTDRNGDMAPLGVQRLTELIGKRVDLKSVFAADASSTIEPLILASGGYPRDLIRLVRNLLTAGRSFPAKAEDISRVIDRLAQDYGITVFGDELDVLVEVAGTHALPLDNRSQLAKFSRLLDRRLVLAYRNGGEWYDLHPMARRDPRIAARLSTRGS